MVPLAAAALALIGSIAVRLSYEGIPLSELSEAGGGRSAAEAPAAVGRGTGRSGELDLEQYLEKAEVVEVRTSVEGGAKWLTITAAGPAVELLTLLYAVASQRELRGYSLTSAPGGYELLLEGVR